MKKTGLFTVAVLAAGLVLGAQVGAQMPPGPGKGAGMRQEGMPRGHGEMWPGMGPGMGPGPGMRMHEWVDFYLGRADQLSLSKEQLAQLRDMKFESDKARVKQHADLQTAQIELEQLRSADPVDARKVEVKIREVFTRRADIAVAVFTAQVAADKILTDEQRAAVKHR